MSLATLVSLERLTSNFIMQRILPFFAVALIAIAQVFIFKVVPTERVMGEVQRIFYFHVAAATTSYLLTGLLLLASLLVLVTNKKAWDCFAQAAAEVGFLLCSIVLFSGMIWGHAAWNTWWQWEPRLISFLVLWLIYFSYIVLRLVAERDERLERYCAILGVLAAANIPIVIYSIHLLSPEQQLHPQVIAERGLKEVSYYYALFISLAGMVLLSLWFWLLRAIHLLQVERLLSLKREISLIR